MKVLCQYKMSYQQTAAHHFLSFPLPLIEGPHQPPLLLCGCNTNVTFTSQSTNSLYLLISLLANVDIKL